MELLSKQRTTPIPFEPRPISGWVLPHLIRLDEYRPGLLAFFCRASPLRRQAVYSTLSRISLDDLQPFLMRLGVLVPGDAGSPELLAAAAETLVRRRARDLVAAAYETCPDGFLGALSRTPEDIVMGPPHYRLLHRLYVDHRHVHKARALRHVGEITPRLLDLVEMIDDPALLRPNVLRALCAASHMRAQDFVETLRFIRSATAVDEVSLRTSLERVSSRAGLRRTLRRWLEDAKVPSSLDLDHPEFHVLSTVAEIKEKAIEYSNCLRTKIPEAVLGLSVYVEWRPSPEKPGAIIELRPLIGPKGERRCFLLQSINIRHNWDVEAPVEEEVRWKLASLGILQPVLLNGTSITASVARTLRQGETEWLDDLEG